MHIALNVPNNDAPTPISYHLNHIRVHFNAVSDDYTPVVHNECEKTNPGIQNGASDANLTINAIIQPAYNASMSTFTQVGG
jgi:hypothetical protein